MMRMLRPCWFLILLGAMACVSLHDAAFAQEWTRFRGPNGSGVGHLAKPPINWTDQDYAWKAELPGSGHSSPVLWGEKLFVTSCDAKFGERMIDCLDATSGKTVWGQRFPAQAYHTHNRNSFATSTPAVDANHLYCCWAVPEEYEVMALKHDGTVAWQTPLGPYKSGHGFGTSPIVHEGLVIVANEQDGGGSLVALDAADGKIRWTVPRQGKNATYSTPCILQSGGRAEAIFTNWQHGITAIDPATGKVSWEISCFEVDKNERAIASPIVAGDFILGTCGFVSAQKHLVAVRPPAQEGQEPREAWRVERAVAYMPTPIYKDGLVFSCSEQGIATCLDAATGKQIWQERLSGNFSGSPVIAGNAMYCPGNKGEVVVLSAIDKYELLARNTLGEETQSTAAIANGHIYFRTARHIIAIGGK